MGLVSRAEFARMMGVHRSTVSKWVGRGRIEPGAGGKIDPQAARAQLSASESVEPHHMARAVENDAQPAPEAPGAEVPAEAVSVALKRETLKLQAAKAEKAALEVDEKAGVLVQRDDVSFVLRAMGVRVRSLLESFADRYTATLAACGGDAAAIHKQLDDAARAALQELSHQLENYDEEMSRGR